MGHHCSCINDPFNGDRGLDEEIVVDKPNKMVSGVYDKANEIDYSDPSSRGNVQD